MSRMSTLPSGTPAVGRTRLSLRDRRKARSRLVGTIDEKLKQEMEMIHEGEEARAKR